MAMPVDSKAHEFVRLKFCPECGYRLEGLATEGRCPECGAQYTSQDIMLYGWKERVDKLSMIFGLGTSVCGSVGLIIGGVVIMLAPGSNLERLGKWKVGRGFRFDQSQITNDKDGA